MANEKFDLQQIMDAYAKQNFTESREFINKINGAINNNTDADFVNTKSTKAPRYTLFTLMLIASIRCKDLNAYKPLLQAKPELVNTANGDQTTPYEFLFSKMNEFQLWSYNLSNEIFCQITSDLLDKGVELNKAGSNTNIFEWIEREYKKKYVEEQKKPLRELFIKAARKPEVLNFNYVKNEKQGTYLDFLLARQDKESIIDIICLLNEDSIKLSEQQYQALFIHLLIMQVNGIKVPDGIITSFSNKIQNKNQGLNEGETSFMSVCRNFKLTSSKYSQNPNETKNKLIILANTAKQLIALGLSLETSPILHILLQDIKYYPDLSQSIQAINEAAPGNLTFVDPSSNLNPVQILLNQIEGSGSKPAISTAINLLNTLKANPATENSLKKNLLQILATKNMVLEHSDYFTANKNFINLPQGDASLSPLALHLKANKSTNSIKTLYFLLDLGADARSVVDDAGNTVLHLMLTERNLNTEAIIACAKKNPELLVSNNKLNQSPLQLALDNAEVKSMLPLYLELIKIRPQALSVANKEGNTFLHLLIKRGSEAQILEILAFKELEAHKNTANQNYETPLKLLLDRFEDNKNSLSLKTFTAIAEKLIQNEGASVLAMVGKSGNSLLDILLSHNENGSCSALIEQVIALNPNCVNEVDNKDNTPIKKLFASFTKTSSFFFNISNYEEQFSSRINHSIAILLQHNTQDLDKLDSAGNSLLHYYAVHNHKGKFNQQINELAPKLISSKNNANKTPLASVLGKNKLSLDDKINTAQLLIKLGANPSEGSTPLLHQLVKYNQNNKYLEQIKTLIAQYPDIKNSKDHNELDALQHFVINSRPSESSISGEKNAPHCTVATVQDLEKLGFDINKPLPNDTNLLNAACDAGNFELAKYLHERGLEIKPNLFTQWVPSEYHKRPFLSAFYPDLWDWLKNKGVKFDQSIDPNDPAQTPLRKAAENLDYVREFIWLMDNGADYKRKDKDNETIFTTAIKNQSPSFLLQYCVSRNVNGKFNEEIRQLTPTYKEYSPNCVVPSKKPLEYLLAAKTMTEQDKKSTALLLLELGASGDDCVQDLKKLNIDKVNGKFVEVISAPVTIIPKSTNVPTINNKSLKLNAKLRNLQEFLYKNITGENSTSRYTHDKEAKGTKAHLLNLFSQLIEEKGAVEFTQKETECLLSLLHAICKIKRNPWHFFGTPHSLQEFNSSLTNYDLSNIKIDKEFELSSITEIKTLKDMKNLLQANSSELQLS